MVRIWGKQFLNRRRDGSSLVTVVIGVLFLAAIGIIVLTAANQFFVSVNVNHNTTNNFYQAEGILEEVKTGLLEYAGDAAEEAYRHMLENYAKDKNIKRDVFSKKYLSLLATKLHSSEGTFEWKEDKLGKAQEADIQKLKMLTNVPDAVTVLKNTNLAFVIKKDNETGEYSLIIRNMLINYTNEAGYRTSIQTDICMSVPDYGLEGNATFDEMKDYISISDDSFQVSDYRISNVVAGNLYSGNTTNGIVIGKGSAVDFKSPTMISRGNLEVHNGANVSLTGESGAGDLYVKNIHLTPGGDKNSTLKTTLTLNENAYVANDLNIQANNATVTLGGKYYGYSYNENNDASSSETASSDYSSAILINGYNTTLQAEHLSSLVLAGRAFVSREKSNNVKTVSDIMMGESIAVKSNQLAYLVPDEYIVSESGNSNDYHNPVFLTEVEEGNIFVDEQGLKDKFGEYLDPNKPYQENYNNTIGYVFYYLKFKNDFAANQYFEKYYSSEELDEDGNLIQNKNELQRKGKVYISNKDLGIKFDQTLYLVAGNVMNNYYNASGTNLQKATYFGNNQLPNDELLAEGKRMGQNYVGRQLGLSPTKNTTGAMRLPMKDVNGNEIEAKTLVNSTILDFENEEFKQNVPNVITVKNEDVTGVEGASLVISKEDYTVSSPMNGLLIVDGNVTINSDYTGLILATGTVTVNSQNLKLQSDMLTVGKLLDYIRTDKKLCHLFRELNGASKKRPSDFSECISYQNWVKNSY